MRIVIALGGNALLERGSRPDADLQELNVERAVSALAPLAAGHQLLITHGNGPQVGVLAVESANDATLTRPYPLDVLGAETQGLIGYWLLQSLSNALPGRRIAAVLTQTVVDLGDPAFLHPTKFVGEVYDQTTATRIAEERQWKMAADGPRWRRVVPSPEPLDVLEAPIIRLLLDAGVIAVCAGGGGIPVVRDAGGTVRGVEAVVDKDLTAALLAGQLGADVLLLLTDVAAVQSAFGTPEAAPILRSTPSRLRGLAFAPGSMGPKIDAACRFVEGGGRMAAIGALADTEQILEGTSGTIVTATGTYPGALR